MVTQACHEKLGALVSFLDHLTHKAPMETLKARLEEVDVSAEQLSEFARFSDKHYVRNLICSGRWYHLLVLCWRSGQRSPIHNHAGSTCGLRVLSGTATETRFEMAPSSLIKPVSSHDYSSGDVAVSEDADIHQVSNLAAPGEDLVTIHIYSPPLLRMDTYSLTDPTIGQFTPMILEHAHGSGI